MLPPGLVEPVEQDPVGAMIMIGCRTGCVVLLAGAVLATWAMVPTARAAGEKAACVESLDRVRQWIRATEPGAPQEEHARVQAAVRETGSLCDAARAASPQDTEVMVHSAYAAFARQDRKAGVALIEQAADAGHAAAMVMLARYHARGELVEKDVEGAWLLLIQALKSDDAAARIQAALEFLPGGAGPENPQRARTVIMDLADQGNSEAMITYAMKVLGLLKRSAGDAEAEEGMALLHRAAEEAGDTQAMIYLSLLYNQGNVVPKDEAKAIEFAGMAIDGGLTRAYGTMGQIYQNKGELEEAASWFRRGAEAGDGFSQGMLGFMYMGGFGVDRSEEEAKRWWTMGRWNGDRLSSGYLQVQRERTMQLQGRNGSSGSSQ